MANNEMTSSYVSYCHQDYAMLDENSSTRSQSYLSGVMHVIREFYWSDFIKKVYDQSIISGTHLTLFSQRVSYLHEEDTFLPSCLDECSCVCTIESEWFFT